MTPTPGAHDHEPIDQRRMKKNACTTTLNYKPTTQIVHETQLVLSTKAKRPEAMWYRKQHVQALTCLNSRMRWRTRLLESAEDLDVYTNEIRHERRHSYEA